MTATIGWIVLGFAIFNTALLVIVLVRALVGRGGDSERAVREELRSGREEAAQTAKDLREEVSRALKEVSESITRTMGELGKHQTERLEAVRGTVDERLRQMQEGNEKKLDEMRKTVDEKLQTTLEKRLGESFRLVSERLEAVQKGLGEMQSLATGVGDLKRVLTNVKTRGTWGEIQLGNILEQILTPDQFERNVQTKEGSREVVEFALKLPGRDGHPDSCVWLPIDSKFPQEDYLRLVEASEASDQDGVQKAGAALARSARAAAQEIESKYVNPPQTTDFALMFLPTEGLYAELLRQPGLAEDIQLRHRVVMAGPTTLAAVLNSLQMGFRTLAIEKRASEVWQVLAAVKTEFGKFGGVLDKVKKQLATASKTIDETGVRTRAMERKLHDVEKLPVEGATALFTPPPAVTEPSADEDEGSEWDAAVDAGEGDSDSPDESEREA